MINEHGLTQIDRYAAQRIMDEKGLKILLMLDELIDTIEFDPSGSKINKIDLDRTRFPARRLRSVLNTWNYYRGEGKNEE